MRAITKTLGIFAVLFIAMIFMQRSATMAAYDQPHTGDNGIQCGNCHFTSGAGTPSWLTTGSGDNTVNNLRCTQCHTGHATHSTTSTGSTKWSTQGGFMVECVQCHNPHYQMQNKKWGSEGYLVTGTVASVGAYNAGTNETVVTLSAPIVGEYQNYYMIPNAADPVYAAAKTYVFKIKTVTSGQTSVTLKGNVKTTAYPYAAAGKTFAIVYGKNLKDAISYTNPGGTIVGSSSVKMFRPTGDRGPGDILPPGYLTETVCYVCHTLISPVTSVVEHTTSSTCSDCHSHDTGFKPPVAGCADCHGNPPGVNGGLVLFQDKNGNPITSDSTGVGAHAAHDSAGYACTNCHTGGMPPSSNGDFKITMGFTLSGDIGGRYNGGSWRTVYEYGATGMTTVTKSVTTGNENCANLYCHSSGQGGTEWATTPSYSNPGWYNPATGQCSTCHAVTSAGLTSGSHVVHLNSLSTMGCGNCHTGAANDGSSYSSPNHVNKQIDAANSYTAGGAAGNGYGTCNAAACHGSGSPKWGTTAGKTGCYRCHGDIANGNAAPGPDTAGETWTSGSRVGAHQAHLKATGNISLPIACTECHQVPANVQAAEHINDGTPGVAEIDWTSSAKANLWGAASNYTGGSCGSTYCHGAAMPKDSCEGSNMQPAWNDNAYLTGVASNDCAKCHGYPPGGTPIGTIAQHLGKVPTDCTGCHPHVNAAGTGFTTIALHIDGVLQVEGCTACHAANNTLPGKHATHYGSASDATSRLATNTSNAANYIFQCGVCHNDQTNHMGTVSFAALSFNSSWTSPTNGTYTANTGNGNDTTDANSVPISTDGTCSNIYCHSNARPAGGTNSYTVVSWNTTVNCGSCHKTTDTAANMAAAGTPQPLSSAHVKHMATDRYGANTNFTCNSCHSGTASNNTTVSDKSKHVNQTKDVAFSGWASGAGASWSGTQCSNTYCHSAGTTSSGTHAAIAWNTTFGCTSCHPTTALATGAHAAHVNDTGNKVGFSVACQECHSATTPDGATISSYVYHVNKNVNVRFDDGVRNKNADNPTYNGASAWTTIAAGSSKAVGAASGSCNNVYCHSSGNNGSITFSNITWTTAIGCGGCHGDTATSKSHPVYASGAAGSATANSHVRHVESSSIGCDKCHTNTVNTAWITFSAATQVVAAGSHLNRVENVDFALNGGKWGSYASSSKTCAATYCHGTSSPAWGTSPTGTCSMCHDATGTALSLRHDKHYNSATAPTVLAGGTDAHTTTTYVYACLQCHPTATHTTGPWNSMADAQLNGAKMAWYTVGASNTTDAKGFKYSVTGTCGTVCHTKDGATVGSAIQAFNWATVSTGGGTCGICHNKAGDAAPVWSTTHTKHVNTYSANTNITCNSCHDAVAASNTALQVTTLARNSHPNQTKNVAFNAWASGAGATWSGTQCSNTYCHSNGTSANAGTHAAIAWNTTFGCTGCHGGPATWTTTTGTGAHAVHVNSQGYTCNTCHNATASNNTTVTGYAIHVNKSVNIQIINTYTSVAGATYNGNAAAWNTIYSKTVGTATGTCNTVLCHGGVSPNWGTINTANAQCVACHGVKPSTPAAYAADNRLAAPGWNTVGVNTSQTTGTLTNNVSNDSKVGAHRKHLGAYTVWNTIGYSNDVACNNCHTVTALGDAGHMNGSTTMTWSSLARNSGTDYTAITGVLTPSFAGGTCSTVYCHGSGFWSSNRGTGLSVGWTSNAYITTVAQAADSASCNRCHLSPPVSNHAGSGAHPGATLSPGGCNSCHGHTGWGTNHIDGKLQASGGSCNSCHWYDTTDAGAWTTTSGISGGTGLAMNASAWGVHVKHVNHLKARWGSVLNAGTDTFGSTAFNNVCGVCHQQTAATTHGPDGGPATKQVNFNGSTARQFGASAPSWNTVTRSCSNLDCHYKPWGTW